MSEAVFDPNAAQFGDASPFKIDQGPSQFTAGRYLRCWSMRGATNSERGAPRTSCAFVGRLPMVQSAGERPVPRTRGAPPSSAGAWT
jgi:hypothetical protein